MLQLGQPAYTQYEMQPIAPVAAAPENPNDLPEEQKLQIRKKELIDFYEYWDPDKVGFFNYK